MEDEKKDDTEQYGKQYLMVRILIDSVLHSFLKDNRTETADLAAFAALARNYYCFCAFLQNEARVLGESDYKFAQGAMEASRDLSEEQHN